MSKWFGTLAGNVESLLDKVDQVAGQALHKDGSDQSDSGDGQSVSSQWQAPSAMSTSAYTPFLSTRSSSSGEKQQKRQTGSLSSSSSIPGNMDQMSRTLVSSNPSPVKTIGKDPTDEELLDFLSNPPDGSNASAVARPSSTGSTRSRKTPESLSTDSTPADEVAAFSDTANNGNSSGYHSSAEDVGVNSLQSRLHVSTAEQENQLLKNEIASLNQEMHSVIQRVQSTQEELQRTQRKLESQSRQLSTSEQIARELRSRESDLQEVISAKDSQLSVLRMRFEEADRLLELERKRATDLQADRERILQDQSSSTGFQTQALDTLQEKLNEAETAHRQEVENLRKFSEDATEKQAKLESEKQALAAQLGTVHRNLDKEKAHNAEMSVQLKAARSQAEASKQELADYKEKAARILQSKDKLISSLKDGSVGNGGKSTTSGQDVMVLMSELESLRQERDVLQDELRSSQHTVESLRTELSDVESQLQQESETSAEQISSLEDQLLTERRRRDDAEIEVNKQKQELRYVHEELLKQKTAFQTRLQDRDTEINRLRNQLTTKSLNASSQEELENRLHSLTESLIQKQTMLEALSSEKSSLLLQLERTEKHYREAEACALRASTAAVNMPESEDARQRNFMLESPFDGKVTRRVKMAANVIDKFSIRLGVFLRRYPIARIFVIMYIGLLHLWVMIVLLTYQPEIHSDLNSLISHGAH